MRVLDEAFFRLTEVLTTFLQLHHDLSLNMHEKSLASRVTAKILWLPCKHPIGV